MLEDSHNRTHSQRKQGSGGVGQQEANKFDQHDGKSARIAGQRRAARICRRKQDFPGKLVWIQNTSQRNTTGGTLGRIKDQEN